MAPGNIGSCQSHLRRRLDIPQAAGNTLLRLVVIVSVSGKLTRSVQTQQGVLLLHMGLPTAELTGSATIDSHIMVVHARVPACGQPLALASRLSVR